MEEPSWSPASHLQLISARNPAASACERAADGAAVRVPPTRQAGTGGDASVPARKRRQAGSGCAFLFCAASLCQTHSWRLLDVPAPGANLITLMQL